MLNTAIYQRNANQKTTSHDRNGLYFKNLQIMNAREGVEKKKLSYTVSGNVNLCNHYG